MNKELIIQMQRQFDELAQTHPEEPTVEFWFARDLQEPLGYARWENFQTTILPTLTIAAKNLATEMTNHNVQQTDLQGEPAIAREHVQNNTSVRQMLGQRGIKPETLPPEEDIKEPAPQDRRRLLDCGENRRSPGWIYSTAYRFRISAPPVSEPPEA